jgi:hypothetical protein
MKGPGSSALRKGRLSVPGASYLITKNILKCPAVSLTDGENPEFLINMDLHGKKEALNQDLESPTNATTLSSHERNLFP